MSTLNYARRLSKEPYYEGGGPGQIGHRLAVEGEERAGKGLHELCQHVGLRAQGGQAMSR